MTLPTGPSPYDLLREKLDARDLIGRLGLSIVREFGSEIALAPLCHESTSGESLHVNTHTGRWLCRACHHDGVYGDLLQFIEYVQTGGMPPSHGRDQLTSETALTAFRWACEQHAIPFTRGRHFSDAALDLVHIFAMEAHRHLLDSPEVLAWVEERWGFGRSIVEDYGIGFMPSPLLPSILQESKRSDAIGAFNASGLGYYGPTNTFTTSFEGRVLFPYLEHGRAVYLIGRSTPWTPQLRDGGTPPKYYKLPVHSEDKRPYVSKRITNDHLYNEPLLAHSQSVVVAEGVADAVTLSALGIPVVSPVTVSFNRSDEERFTRKLHEHKIKRVEILFDNELSGVGNSAAVRVGTKLVRSGVSATVITLPLGDQEKAASEEVRRAMGPGLFREYLAASAIERKQLIKAAFPDKSRREWLVSQIKATKIDAAEWVAREGAGAAGRFDSLRKSAVDVVEHVANLCAEGLDPDADLLDRLYAFKDAIELAAHVDEFPLRRQYAGVIAKLAGKGITKSDVAESIASERRARVKPQRKKDAAEREQKEREETAAAAPLILPPPFHVSEPSTAPPPPSPEKTVEVDPAAPAAPAPPEPERIESEREHYAGTRYGVLAAVERKVPDEVIGKHVADLITGSMQFTAFRTPDDLYLVRGSQRVRVGVSRSSARFRELIYLASGLNHEKATHRAYIAATKSFLEEHSRPVEVVAWSFVDEVRAVYFPTGDAEGRIVKIEPGSVTLTRMSEVQVPAVAGEHFKPFRYVPGEDGVRKAFDAFRWTSLSEGDRLVLVHYLATLPILRRIGQIPIVRIEGGSGSGKTRAVDAASYLVNGRKSSSVPTAAAMTSRLSIEMLTFDDNREKADVTPALLATLLQVTHQGAKEKRKANTDTGTVVERVCGGLLMNGIEPIHDGKSEIASRILTLRCSASNQSSDSPRDAEVLLDRVLSIRDEFWTTAVQRCAAALELDVDHGEELGRQIEEVFGTTRIGRTSAYLRVAYLTWVAGLPEATQPGVLRELAPVWRTAFAELGRVALDSLLGEELAVTVARYAMAYGRQVMEKGTEPDVRVAFDGRYQFDLEKGDEVLGPMRASRLARIAREAGKQMNAPAVVTNGLTASQLEARLLDGADYLAEAGIAMQVERTRAGRLRFTLYRENAPSIEPPEDTEERPF